MAITKKSLNDIITKTKLVDNALALILKRSPKITEQELKDRIGKLASGGGIGTAHPSVIEELVRPERY